MMSEYSILKSDSSFRGKIANMIYQTNESQTGYKDITSTPDFAFYGKEGKIIQALNPEWKQFVDLVEKEESD